MIRVPGPFLAEATLRGGQAFRWRKASDGYLGVAHGTAFRVTPENGEAAVETWPPSDGLAASYFRLSDDYPGVLRRLGGEPRLTEAVRSYRGLRLLRQDPWECFSAFLVSAVNNVPRIEQIVERLAESLGPAHPAPPWWPGPTYHAFPDPATVARAGPARLRSLGLGFRAGRLAAAARRLTRESWDISSLSKLPRADAREALLSFDGVGEKVADCVLLFSLDHLDAFPVDRWVARAVGKAGSRGPRTSQDVSRRASERWGKDAGYAQQFLFHKARMEKIRPTC